MRAVLLLGLLAGCVAPASVPEPAPAMPALDVARFAGCADQTGHFPMPYEEARDRLPPPLEPEPYFWTGEGASAWRWVLAARCELQLDDEAVGAVVFVMESIVVDAPEAMWPENASFLVVPTAFHSGDAALAARLAAWGEDDTRHDPVEFEISDGSARTGRATWPGGTFTVATATTEGTQGDDFVRLYLAASGEISGAVDLVVTESRVRRGAAALDDGTAGLGGHFWGDDYDWTMTPAPPSAWE